MSKIRTIVVSGGTHGNERTGVRLIKKWQDHPEIYTGLCPGVEIQTVLANESAIRLNRRYDFQDLNRSFSNTSLAIEGKSLCYEINRARELNAKFGPKGKDTKTDLLIDVHNTTANMGLCLILSERDPFCMRASALLTKEFPTAKIYYQPEERGMSPYFGTIAKADLCLEIGPQCHGTLNAALFEETERLVIRYLELVRHWNEGELQKLPGTTVDVYTQYKDIDYPRDERGDICAMIHPDLRGKDYEPLKTGDKLYRTFDGKDILFDGKDVGADTVWPIFIDEAAYYEKKISMSLTLKTTEVW